MCHYVVNCIIMVASGKTAVFMKPLCLEILYVYNNAQCSTFHIGINYLQRHLHCWPEHDLSLLLWSFSV